MLGRFPVIVYHEGETLPPDQETGITRIADICTVRRVRSPERLLDQAVLFMHRALSRLTPERREALERLHSSDSILTGRKVLVVDDDIRNIFALSSVLERHQMKISLCGKRPRGPAIVHLACSSRTSMSCLWTS